MIPSLPWLSVWTYHIARADTCAPPRFSALRQELSQHWLKNLPTETRLCK